MYAFLGVHMLCGMFAWCRHVVRDVRLMTHVVRDVRLDASDLVDVVLDQLGVVELHVPAHTQISDKEIFERSFKSMYLKLT